MPRKSKEEDRIERIIRDLLKKPENRRCINCNNLGPQYVCTTFCTFVCTNCSAVHREFSHRVKSVSMAKFNPEEIISLQAGGNERAKQIYFKTWDPTRMIYPESSNLYRIREFIKHVYIDRKYAGQVQKPDLKKDEMYNNRIRNDYLERRSLGGGSSHSSKEEIELHLYSPSRKSDLRNALEERRSPRNVPDNVRSGSHKSRGTRFEIVDDRFRDDGRIKLYDRYSSGKEPRSGSMSPVSPMVRDKNLPAIRNMKEIFGNRVPILAIAPPPKAKIHAEGASGEKKAADVASPGSANGKQKQDQTVNCGSLIDFDANPEPNTPPSEPQKQIVVASNNNNESTSSPLSTTTTTTENASNLNSVESLLFGFSDSGTTSSPAGTPRMPAGVQAPSLPNNSDQALAITVVDKDQTLNSNSNDSLAIVTQQWNNNNNNTSAASNDSRLVSNVPTSQATESGDRSNPNGRKELPADLFASNFTGFAQPSPSWQMRPPHGYGMQFYPPAMSIPAYSQPARPSNPFDIGDDGPQAQPAPFPLMSPLHGALPNVQIATALQPQPSPYGTAFSPQVPPYGMSIPLVPGAYMGQQTSNMQLARPQGNANSQDAFASLNPIHHQTNRLQSFPAQPNSPLSRAGNPFG